MGEDVPAATKISHPRKAVVKRSDLTAVSFRPAKRVTMLLVVIDERHVAPPKRLSFPTHEDTLAILHCAQSL